MQYYKEILILEGILLTLIWIFNDYLASLITFIFVPLIFAIMIVSFISEKIAHSNIPPTYFKMMWGLFLIPIVLFLVFSQLGGGLSWLSS